MSSSILGVETCAFTVLQFGVIKLKPKVFVYINTCTTCVTFNCKVLRKHWLLITTYVIYLRKEHGVEQVMYMFVTGYKLMNIRDVLKISLALVRVGFTCYRDEHVN